MWRHSALMFTGTICSGQTGMSDRSLWLTAQQQLILMRVCFSGYGFVVYISSTLAGGSQIQGQPGLHSKTLYLFLKTFTKQNTRVTLESLGLFRKHWDRETGDAESIFYLKHFLSIYFFCWAVIGMRWRSSAGHSKCAMAREQLVGVVLLWPCGSVDLAASAFTHWAFSRALISIFESHNIT